MLDPAFEALKTYDWGVDKKVLKPLDDAVVAATKGDDAARKDLEKRLTAMLSTDISRDARQVICRKLMLIGSAACVPALSKLLAKEEDSHMARYALERINTPEAAKALREALANLSSKLKVGVISSLGVRQDADSVAPLGKLIGDSDKGVARAAAYALGAIRSPEAAKTLTAAKPAAEVKSAVTDASLACAERLVAAGKKTDALAIYKGLSGEDQPKHVRLAATRGVLACAGK